jgi:hypothetical protein
MMRMRMTVGGRLPLLKKSVAHCVTLLCVIALAGCATYARKQQQNSFEDITEAYGNAIRWGKYEVTNDFRSGDEGEEDPDFEHLKNIKVTSYELKAVNVSSDGNTVLQDVEIEYYIIDRLIEKTIIDHQLWKYDGEKERWFLHGTLPDFK